MQAHNMMMGDPVNVCIHTCSTVHTYIQYTHTYIYLLKYIHLINILTFCLFFKKIQARESRGLQKSLPDNGCEVQRAGDQLGVCT